MTMKKNHSGIEMRLASDRLSIRPIKEDDAPQLLDVMKSFGLADADYVFYSTEEDAIRYIRESFENDIMGLALFLRGDEDTLIGIIHLCALFGERDCNGKICLRVDHLVHRVRCRPEFLAEAYKSISKELFEKHDVALLVFQAYSEDEKALRVAELSGFTRNDIWDDMIFYEDYEGCREGYTMVSPYVTACSVCRQDCPKEFCHSIGCPHADPDDLLFLRNL